MKKSVMIFGREVKVKKVKGMMKEQSLFGCYDYDKMEIQIDADLPPKTAYSTLLHEMGHAMFHRAGLVQSKLTRDLEEVIVEQFSIMISENFPPRQQPVKKNKPAKRR